MAKVRRRRRRSYERIWTEIEAMLADFQPPADESSGTALKKRERRAWPGPMDKPAFHGLVGEFIRVVLPSTEADPVALLLQFLTAFGNAIGRSAHFIVEETKHYTKLFVLIVGKTSKARKGVSWERVKSRFEEAVGDWADTRIQSGLSSGEGLINAVRDAHTKVGRGKDGKAKLTNIPGAKDKRLLVYESEFAAVLAVKGREGNTLSTLIRQAWDDVALQTLTKVDPMRATKAHISIVGHITEAELKRRLTELDAANGFGNRFLIACAKRSKLLPLGGSVPKAELEQINVGLGDAIAFAEAVDVMTFSANSRKLWEGIYMGLSEERDGMYDALTARAEAQILRVACIYALLDKSAVIEPVHLQAAKAVWDYVDASIAYLFGESLGDPVADRILANLLEKEEGLTRSEIHGLFSKGRSAEQIQNALDRLENRKLAWPSTESTAGRPIERWFAV